MGSPEFVTSRKRLRNTALQALTYYREENSCVHKAVSSVNQVTVPSMPLNFKAKLINNLILTFKICTLLLPPEGNEQSKVTHPGFSSHNCPKN